ncbi:MAG: hypothetical protein LBC65_03835 [Oscillospiraceae bacterium]|jgi:hypothetical protein|nr:hypothetical protein [Oscillospiraceae bacterium]
MVHKIMKVAICAADALLAATVVLLLLERHELGRSAMDWSLIALIAGILVAAYASDRGYG